MDSRISLTCLGIGNDASTAAENRRQLHSPLISRVRFTSWFQTIWITFLFISNSLLIFILLSRGVPHKIANSSTSAAYFTTNFTANPKFMSIDHQNDHVWEELSLDGLTLLDTHSIDRWEKGDYSMFHQLHCLTSMRKALQDSLVGLDIGVDWHDNGHWPHCLDYLAQTFLCYADDTIETGDVIRGVLTDNISGYQAARRCKYSKEVYDLKIEGIRRWDHSHKDWALRHCDTNVREKVDSTCIKPDFELVEASKALRH